MAVPDGEPAPPGSEAGVARPAFYSRGRGDGGWGDWLSLLHPPYTAWNLSYVAIGASLAHPIRLDRLGWSLLGFFLGLGVGAHVLDELHGRPMRTGIPRWALATVGFGSIAGAGVDGWLVGGLHLLPFIAVGALLAIGYNLEWFGGVLHNTVGLAASWGSFTVLTGYYTQHWSISISAVLVAFTAFGLIAAQRTLSTPARWLRRSAHDVRLSAVTADGTSITLGATDLLRPLEVALKLISWSFVPLALGMVLAAR
jgi:hypothetical protein